MLNVNKKDYKVYESTIDVLNQENLSFYVDKRDYPESDFLKFENFVISKHNYICEKDNPNYLLFIHKECKIDKIMNVFNSQINTIKQNLKIFDYNIDVIRNLVVKGSQIIEYDSRFNNCLFILKAICNDKIFYLE